MKTDQYRIKKEDFLFNILLPKNNQGINNIKENKKLIKIDEGFNKFVASYPISLIKNAYKKLGVNIKPLGASLYSIKSVKTKSLLS